MFDGWIVRAKFRIKKTTSALVVLTKVFQDDAGTVVENGTEVYRAELQGGGMAVVLNRVARCPSLAGDIMIQRASPQGRGPTVGFHGLAGAVRVALVRDRVPVLIIVERNIKPRKSITGTLQNHRKVSIGLLGQRI